MEKRINLPGPIRNRVLVGASVLSTSLVAFSRGALCCRADGPVASKAGAFSFDDRGGLDGLPTLKPLEPWRLAKKRRKCSALGSRI